MVYTSSRVWTTYIFTLEEDGFGAKSEIHGTHVDANLIRDVGSGERKSRWAEYHENNCGNYGRHEHRNL